MKLQLKPNEKEFNQKEGKGKHFERAKETMRQVSLLRPGDDGDQFDMLLFDYLADLTDVSTDGN
ncbi:uncharacterized protein CCR75_007734 [Bremia lactucae]|uniref:Uncharacterized protein n=1 Tax=Bremia lactucae TaxID=4779 RepID=A0A976IJC3_BRELC|nr:hypothetical protein CCR75_007734 [Bremia lactucae]